MDDKTILCAVGFALAFWLGTRYARQQSAAQQQSAPAAPVDPMAWLSGGGWAR